VAVIGPEWLPGTPPFGYWFNDDLPGEFWSASSIATPASGGGVTKPIELEQSLSNGFREQI
jgi:hypothetical protein